MPSINSEKLKNIAQNPLAAGLVVSAVVAGAVGYSVAKVANDDPQREDKLIAIGEALSKGSAQVKEQKADNLDTASLHDIVKSIRDADPQLVDLGGQLLQPGEYATVGVNLPRGARMVSFAPDCVKLGGTYNGTVNVCLLGPSQSTWNVGTASCVDREDDLEHTWCEFRLRNDATTPQRVIAYQRWEIM